jgi:hypothetical protein
VADPALSAAATLHRDLDESSTFISFGPWTSVEEIDRVRTSDTFQEGVAKIRPFLADFTTHTMEIAGGVEWRRAHTGTAPGYAGTS